MLRILKKEYELVNQRLTIDGVEFSVGGGNLNRCGGMVDRKEYEKEIRKFEDQISKRIVFLVRAEQKDIRILK